MIFHSIRWRLQLWHSLLLVLVLAGFGVTAFQLLRGQMFRRMDEELQQRAAVVGNALRRPGPDQGPPPRAGQPGPPDRAGDPNRPPPRGLRLTDRDAALFETETNSFYFVTWLRDGNLLQASASAPANVPRPDANPGTVNVRQRGLLRELCHSTPPGDSILVGRNVARELDELRRIGWLLFAAGAAVLLLGLAGGWWLSTRAIRPIRDISGTAAKIAAGDLSQRIQTDDADSELGQLAGVLNSTFARLDAAFAQQAQFTADAAHELRTPVSVMLTQTQSTLNRERSAAEYRGTLEACQRSAQRMRRLIESLLELARLDAGQETIHRRDCDLAQLVNGSLEQVRPLAEPRQITFRTDLTNTHCQLDADRFALVLQNLLSNAIHYNRDGGEVRVAVRSENGLAVLTVEDTGCGIASDNLPRIFERFYRADQSRSGAGHSGLGLAIARAIVTAHGGTVDAASEPGVGTKFTVRLPQLFERTSGS